MKEEEQCQTSHLLWKIIGNESKSPGFYNVVVLQFMQLQCIFFCFIFAPLLYLSIYQHPTGRLRCQKLERKSQGESIRPKKRELHELPQNGLLRTVFVPLLFTYCTSIHAYQAQTSRHIPLHPLHRIIDYRMENSIQGRRIGDNLHLLRG